MELERIEKNVKMIKEQVVDRIEYHFNDYQMVNIERHTYDDSVIDDKDWYEYWKEVSFDIKVLLGDILKLIEAMDESEDSRAKELLKETFDYKMLCDKYITSNKYYSREDIEEANIINNEESYIDPFSPLEVVNEEHKDSIILLIHTFLFDKDLIKEDGIENFRKLFNHESKPTMIKWRGDAILFVAFINLMIDRKVLVLPHKYKDKCWEYFSKVFLNQDGNQFSTKLLGNRKTQLSYDKKKNSIKEGLLPLLASYIT